MKNKAYQYATEVVSGKIEVHGFLKKNRKYYIKYPQLKLNFIELIIKDIKIELNDNELIEEDQ